MASKKQRPAGDAPHREDGEREDMPAAPRNFIVVIDGVEIGFASLSRLTSETVAEEAPGARRKAARKIHRYARVVLRRALGSDRRLYLWREHIVAGKADRRQVVIRHLDTAGDETVASWILEGAWPCRWSGPAFDANATDFAMEEIELAFDRLLWR